MISRSVEGQSQWDVLHQREQRGRRVMLSPPPPQMMHQKEVRGVIIAFYDGFESSWMWNRDIDIFCSSKALLGEWNEHLSCY